MARPLRLDQAGGWYHLTARGNERRPTFRDDRDRSHFLELLCESTTRFAWRLHAYVLMPNHYHLMVETTQPNLSRSMQWLNGSYTTWFNRRHRRVGHLFQGRFKSIVLDGESYALELSRYVHLNPVRVKSLGLDKARQRERKRGEVAVSEREVVRARLARLRAYRWSSYRGYAGWEAGPLWVRVESVLGLVGGGGSVFQRRRRYRRYVEEAVREGVEESPWERLEAGVLLGGPEFVRRMRRRLVGDEKEQPSVRQLQGQAKLQSVVDRVARGRGESWDSFRDRHGDWGRDAVLYLGRRYCGVGLRELGEAVGGIDYRSVGTAVKRFEKRLSRDKRLASEIRTMERQLQNEET
jgi:REP-associated tyrosine transposase